MGVVQTDKWIEKDFQNPLKMCERLIPYFEKQSINEIYKQLLFHGMYRPSAPTRNAFEWMVKEKTWKQITKVFEYYQKKWQGPEIPIFLFPFNQTRGIFSRNQDQVKSGLSFPDKMFLFLTEINDPKEIEALFVHEYHHVCRLNILNKKMEEYTLRDSIIIEGLAEYAVLENCGEQYTADWCHMYSKKELSHMWKMLENQLDKRKSDRTHDQLLYGGGRVPKLLGYALGFYLVDNYFKTHSFSPKLSFSIQAEKIIKNIPKESR
ncbi:MAG: DUF2268 domain-containing protein [Bacillota bacterium]|nr:DUF2268 domain-containing protein [Bacillota bacterium]